MAVTLYVDSDSNLGLLLSWGLRIARARGRQLRLVLASAAAAGDEPQVLDLEGGEDAKHRDLAQEVHGLLDAELGADRWLPQLPDPGQEAPDLGGDSDDADAPASVRVELVAPTAPVAAWLRPSNGDAPDLLVAVQPRYEKEESASSARRRAIFQGATCEVVFLRPGDGGAPGGGGVLVAAARGPHARAALQCGRELAQAGHGALSVLVVQKDLGPDSHGVGRRKLEAFLERGVGREDAAAVATRIVIDEHRHTGIQGEVERLGADLVLLGATKRGALGQRLRGTVSQKLLKASARPAVAIVRAAIPITGRTQRLVNAWLQRTVPQLERESRVALAERVQSNSQWDFDFMTLMSLSTLIAAAGLIANSAAVIIGAMLVAPLMTPIMGVGMALVQGNPRLLGMALRSVCLGYLNAFVLGVLLGLVQPGLVEPTAEMLERGWPGFLELFVAFVAGLAGVYSSSRPSLIAALPGVAIAAALVPPIATAGVACAIGAFDLALGASLLFATNFVAIVLASTFALAAVGLRTPSSGSGSRVTRVTGALLVFSALALALGFSSMPSRHVDPTQGPEGLVEELEALLGHGGRVVELVADPERSPVLVELLVAGREAPNADLARDLHAAVARAWGAPVALRLRSSHEQEIRGEAGQQ